MTRQELLNSRGFKDEKHLKDFLENCKDAGWKKELIDFYGEEPKEEKTEVKKTSKNSKEEK
jgi:hypothetical protein